MNTTGNEYRALLSELHVVLTEKTDIATSDRIVLRDAVCAYVAAERSRGVTLKRVVQTVKEILTKAEEGTAKANEELAKQLVEWCTEFHRAARAEIV